jgi:hypothetical protein
LPLNEGIGLIQRDYCNFVGLKDSAPINYQSPVDNANLLGGNQMPQQLQQQQQQQGHYAGPGGQEAKAIGASGSNEYSPFGMAAAGGSKVAPHHTSGGGMKTALGGAVNSKLPEEVRYALRSTIEDNSAQFLSLSQFDLVINFYQREREKLTTYQKGNGSEYGAATTTASGQSIAQSHNDSSKANLLENPQVKAALNSLFQMGAINTSALSKGAAESNVPYMNGAQSGAAGPPSSAAVAYPGSGPSNDCGFMYDQNSFKMMSQAPSGSYSAQYHEAPSYLSTDPMSNAPGSIAGDMFASNQIRRMESPNRSYRSVRPSRFQ